jgi:hypothetical protein
MPLMLYFLWQGDDWDRMIRAFETDLVNRNRVMAPSGAFGVGTGDELTALGVHTVSQDPVGRAVAALACQFGWVEGGSLQHAITKIDEASTVEPDIRPDLPTLELAAASPDSREHWRQYRRVEVEGMFNPAPQDARIFQIVRLRMACCLNDARPASVVGASRLPVQVQPGQWVKVQGRVVFQQFPDGSWKPVLQAIRIEPKRPPANPYIS